MRVFLALDLPDDVRAALALQQYLLPLPRRVDPQALHVTLVFLGETDLAVLEAVHEAWENLNLPALTVQIQGLGLFGGNRPRLCYAGFAANPPLMALQARVETAARRAGAAPQARRFVPHVTLGRFSSPPPEAAFRLERAVAQGAGFALPAFAVSQMVLYESLMGGKAVQYRPLARYPLTA